MFQSTSGFYDRIDVGYLRPDFDKDGLPPLVAREWVDFELLGGRSGAKVTTRSQKFPPWTKVVFEETATFIEKVIGQHKKYVSEDPDWLFARVFMRRPTCCRQRQFTCLTLVWRPRSSFEVLNFLTPFMNDFAVVDFQSRTRHYRNDERIIAYGQQ